MSFTLSQEDAFEDDEKSYKHNLRLTVNKSKFTLKCVYEPSSVYLLLNAEDQFLEQCIVRMTCSQRKGV